MRKPINLSRLGICIVSLMLLFCNSSPLYANPTGSTVVSGSVSFNNPDSTTLQITQSTNQAIINWQDFSIQANEHTAFIQPSASSIILNRVIGSNPSQILGSLTANGQVMLINPAGIIFGKGSQVDVAGLIASTGNITDQ